VWQKRGLGPAARTDLWDFDSVPIFAVGPNCSVEKGECLLAANLKSQVEEAQKTIDLTTKVYTAELKTTKGPIRLRFFPDVAPGHVKNFLALAKIGFYNNLTFHRVIPGFMIQGGCPQGTGTGDAGYKIKAEFNGTPHEAGVLSMARTGDPDSAGSQFFICLDRASHLDRKYSAFGKLADEESMRSLQAIGAMPTDANDRPKQKMVMESVVITEAPK
jgi:peptidyl-prolyl cis-trans isomerase B (cyclophilin B)